MKVLLDTSVYSQPLRKQPLQAVMHHWRSYSESDLAVSAICDLEVRYGVYRAGSDVLRAAYDKILKGRLVVLPFDDKCAEEYARIQAQSVAHGETRPVFDLMIAVTALANRLPLATCNPRDFVGIPDLEVLDWSKVPAHPG